MSPMTPMGPMGPMSAHCMRRADFLKTGTPFIHTRNEASMIPSPAMIASVAAGGALGAAARFVVTSFSTRALGMEFPWGTMIVNIAGSFVMGLLITFMALKWSTSQEMRAFLTTGALGGFTTFSAFALDFATLWERKAHMASLAYAMGSVLAAIAALFAGLMLARALFAP